MVANKICKLFVNDIPNIILWIFVTADASHWQRSEVQEALFHSLIPAIIVCSVAAKWEHV